MILVDLSSYQLNEMTKELCNAVSTISKHGSNKSDMIITIITQEEMSQELTELPETYGMKLVIVQHVKKDAASYRGAGIVAGCVDSFCVEMLTEDTRTRIIKKCVNLFGTSVALGKIIEQTDPLSYLLDLIQMNEQESKSLHKTKYEEINQWYVDRRFVSYNQGKSVYFDDNDNLPGLTHGATSSKVNIILNDAGFGKSSFFTKLSWRLSSIIHSSFVIRLNAIEYSTYFKQLMNIDVYKLDALSVLKILYRFIYLALLVHDGTKQTDADIQNRRKEADESSKLLILSNARLVVDDDTAKAMN
uniref:Uncharacterized protein n=1 Tax=Anopheles dirus TaxID=7168 RepID=A0A182NYV9_9DIPT